MRCQLRDRGPNEPSWDVGNKDRNNLMQVPYYKRASSALNPSFELILCLVIEASDHLFSVQNTSQ